MNNREKRTIDFLDKMVEKLTFSGCGLTFTQWLGYYNYYETAVSFGYKNIDYVKYGNALLNHQPFCATSVEDFELAEKKVKLLELLENERLTNSSKKGSRR